MVVARPCYVFGMAVEPKVRINCYTVINTVTHKLKNVLYAVFSSLPWKASWSRGTSSTCVCGPHTPHSHQHNRFMALFPGPPGRAGARRELLDFMVQGKINRDTLTIRLGATPSRLTSAHLHHPRIFLQAGCPSCRPTNSVKALKATLHSLR